MELRRVEWKIIRKKDEGVKKVWECLCRFLIFKRLE